MNFMIINLLSFVFLIKTSYQECVYVTEETLVKLFSEEFYIFNPAVLGFSQNIQVNLIKILSDINQYSSNWKHEENFQLILQLNEATFKSNENQLELENVEKGIIILEDFLFSDWVDVRRFEINQEAYFYESLTCTLYERYEINNVIIKRVLGKVNNDKFVWNTEVHKRYVVITYFKINFKKGYSD